MYPGGKNHPGIPSGSHLICHAEQKPLFAWKLNMDSLLILLELGSGVQAGQDFLASRSIAVFGRAQPRENTSQYAVKEPTTVYGISKLAGERWCEYTKELWRNVRSLRVPGIDRIQSPPRGHHRLSWISFIRTWAGTT